MRFRSLNHDYKQEKKTANTVIALGVSVLCLLLLFFFSILFASVK